MYAFCLQLDFSGGDVDYSRFIGSLNELGAMASTIKTDRGVFLIAINKELLDFIMNKAFNSYVKKKKSKPNNMYMRITSNNYDNYIISPINT